MDVYTVARIVDYGPALSRAEVDLDLRAKLQQGVDYYREHGIDGGSSYRAATIGRVRIADRPSHIEDCRARRIEAEVTFL